MRIIARPSNFLARTARLGLANSSERLLALEMLMRLCKAISTYPVMTASVVFAVAAPLSAQWLKYPAAGIPRLPSGKPDLAAPVPRSADGKPDLSGLWASPLVRLDNPLLGPIERPREFIDIGATLPGGLPLQPWARDLTNARRAGTVTDNPLERCLPTSPVMALGRELKKIVQTSGLLLILSEYNVMYRQIFTDGRPLPTDPNRSWNGYSTGKWDGDTLVVQTNGFRDGLWLDLGHSMTDAAKLTERFRRVNFGRLEIEITVDDPKAFTKPWTVKLEQTLEPDTDLLEYVCLENEKDARHYVK